MFKIFFSLFLLFIFSFFTQGVFAKEQTSFVNIVNPIRGSDFWEEKGKPEEAVKGQMEILNKNHAPATWLVRYDALKNPELLNLIKSFPLSHEKGLFLEITPTWTTDANVNYRKSSSWHSAGSVFLAGYEQVERKKLIDRAFEEFKGIFGVYPKSVGAWWIDSFSLDYMENKYGIIAALIVADQYTTDNYQIWGQYWSAPFYPSKTNALNPAQDTDNKIPVVMMQWATRDPVNGYGKGVEESTLSVQPNDYIDFHNLNIDYFSSLIDIYTKQNLNPVNEVVVGLENSYSWEKYKDEYQKQVEVLTEKSRSGQFSLNTMSDFASWYKEKFQISPPHIIFATDPLGGNKKVVWFMNPYYRVGWFATGAGSIFRDIRQYVNGSEEICYFSPCKEINFATFATRVLDEVTNGNRWMIDEGRIENIEVKKEDNSFVISYNNMGGKTRTIQFLPRDLQVDSNVYSVDSAILQATTSKNAQAFNMTDVYLPAPTIFKQLLNAGIFIGFVVFAVFIPGFVFLRKVLNADGSTQYFLSVCMGIINIALVAFIAGLLRSYWILWVYCILILLVFLKNKMYKNINLQIDKGEWLPIMVIFLGVIFQVMPVIKSGLMFNIGIGFWGPNTHDGVWHIALVNELLKGVPAENPIFSGVKLTNYHYFYDLLVAVTNKLTGIPIPDLIFRMYPVLLSVLLGVGSYLLAKKLFLSKLAAIFGVYFVYFAGSFGWIVEFLRERHIGGESAFWSNQPVSFNLNPPFAISLILVIALIHLLIIHQKKLAIIPMILILGSLVEFKAYAAIAAYGAFLVLSLTQIKKYFLVLIGAGILSALLLLPNYRQDQFSSVFIWAPFWFVHSMIDAPDRVGWTRLSLTRMVGFEQGNWFKIIASEGLGLFIFWAGNLGVRILSVFALKDYLSNPLKIYILAFTLICMVFPLLFIQAGNPWNTVQFFYYALFTTALASGFVLAKLYRKNVICKILVVACLLIAPINTLVTANSYLYKIPHSVLSLDQIDGLQFLSTKPDGVVLTFPYNPELRMSAGSPIPIELYDTTSYVSAFSKKPTFIEDEIQQSILQTAFKERLFTARNFFGDSNKNWSEEFIKENQIKYIYLPKIFKAFVNTDLPLTKIYENMEVIIYETNI